MTIDHVGIAVSDPEAAIHFYTRVLGMQITHEETNDEQGVHEVMLSPPVPRDSAPSGLGWPSTPTRNTPARNTTQIQLLSPTHPDTPVGKFLEQRGAGIHHIAIAVNDIESATRRVLASEVRVLYKHLRTGTGGSSINFLHPKDTNGVLIELVQHPVI